MTVEAAKRFGSSSEMGALQLNGDNSQFPTANSQGGARSNWLKVLPTSCSLGLSANCSSHPRWALGVWELGVVSERSGNWPERLAPGPDPTQAE